MVEIQRTKRQYFIKSPSEVVFIVDNLTKFCREHDLDALLMRNHINKGVIPAAYSGCKTSRVNMTGWTIKDEFVDAT